MLNDEKKEQGGGFAGLRGALGGAQPTMTQSSPVTAQQAATPQLGASGQSVRPAPAAPALDRSQFQTRPQAAPAAPAVQSAGPASSVGTITGTPRQPANPYARGPSGFVGFQQYLGANRTAADRSAAQVNKKVRGAAEAAEGRLQSAYGDFQGQVQDATSAAIGNRGPDATGRYEGLQDFDTSGLQDEFAAAQGQVDALGTPDGIGTLMGNGRDWFSSGLVGSVGANDFAATRQRFGKLQSALSDAAVQGQREAGDADQRVRDYFGATQEEAAGYDPNAGRDDLPPGGVNTSSDELPPYEQDWPTADEMAAQEGQFQFEDDGDY